MFRGRTVLLSAHIQTPVTLMQTFLPIERWTYAYPGVREGNFTGCSSTVTACAAHMPAGECFLVTCESASIQCPPPGQDLCPGFDGEGCSDMPGSKQPFWSHSCSPGIAPMSDTKMQLSCSTSTSAGGFDCEFVQVWCYSVLLF